MSLEEAKIKQVIFNPVIVLVIKENVLNLLQEQNNIISIDRATLDQKQEEIINTTT